MKYDTVQGNNDMAGVQLLLVNCPSILLIWTWIFQWLII